MVTITHNKLHPIYNNVNWWLVNGITYYGSKACAHEWSNIDYHDIFWVYSENWYDKTLKLNKW